MAEMEVKELVVRLIDGTTFKGKTNIQDNNRLSDLLNRDDNTFLIMFDVNMVGYEGNVIFLNKNQIMWAIPLEKE